MYWKKTHLQMSEDILFKLNKTQNGNKLKLVINAIIYQTNNLGTFVKICYFLRVT